MLPSPNRFIVMMLIVICGLIAITSLGGCTMVHKHEVTKPIEINITITHRSDND